MSHLNEVLSIRAQEYKTWGDITVASPNLNEVLSIRAQEFLELRLPCMLAFNLNEVLSIRAQEYSTRLLLTCRLLTSMKS